MIDLLKNKRGSQKLIILIVSAILLVAVSIGAFFYVRNAVGKDIESNPLQEEQNTTNTDVENNDNSEQNSSDVSDESEDAIADKNETENIATNNVTNNNQNTTNTTTGTNQGTLVYEDTYFQEFVEEKIVNKAWKRLDVSWEPVAFVGALIPADATTRKPVIELEKECSVTEKFVTVGDEIVYTINAKNTGNEQAKNLEIIDEIDTEFLDIIEVNDDGIYEDETITWNIETLDAGSSISVSFKAKVKEISDEKVIESDEIILSNTAYVTGDNIKDGESNTVENEYLKPIISGVKESFVTRNGEVEKATSVKKGEVIKYQIILTNKGTLEKEVTVEDILPETLTNVTLVSEDENAKVTENKIVWKVTVPARNEEGDGVVTLVYTAKVAENAKGTVLNSVTISDGTKVEPTKDPIIEYVKSSTIENKENATSVTTGDVIIYTVRVTNTSEDIEATNINVTDVVPAGTKLVEGSITENGTTTDNKNIAWNIEKIEKGSFVDVSFKVEVLKNDLNTVISNTAYVEEDSTNTDEIKYVRANFNVTKTADKQVVKLNEDITYTVTVTNSGTGTGTETVTDIIPVENVDLDEESIVVTNGETKFVLPNLNWTLTLDAGKSATLTYTVNVKSGTKIENTVTTPDDNTKTTTPVIKITKDAVETVRPNGVIEYTIKVENTSDVDATNVDLTDTLQEGLTYNNDANPNANYDDSTKTLKWTNQTIAKGATNTYTFTATVDKNIALGTVITNIAYVDETPSNEEKTVVNEARITATKSVNKKEAKSGDTLSYTITVKNDGNISDVATIVDTLSENVKYVENTLKVDGDKVNYATCVNNVVTVENLEVSAGEEVLITFDVTILESVEEAIINTATITTDGKDTETTPTVTNVVKKTVTDETGVAISNNVHHDQILVYNIKISNKGNSESKDFEIVDEIAAGLEYVSNSVTDNGIFDDENNKVTWNITLSANEEKTVSFKVKVLNTLENLDTISNTATVNGVNTNTVTNTYVTSILSSSKKAYVNGDKTENATNAIKVGDKITYVISVTNSGNYKAENVSVVDTLPEGTKLVSGNLSQTIQTIEAGKTESVEFTVEVIKVNTTIKNTATVNGEPTNSEVNPYLVISKKSDVELQSKILTDNEVTTGSVLKYTIKVENNSEVDAKNVVIKDTIPQGTTLKQDSLHQISDNGVLNGSEITWTIDVKAKSYEEVSFFVTVNENENGTIISNNAYVNGDKTSTTDEYIKAIISGTKDSFVTRDGNLVDAESVLAGDVITYKITLENNGFLEMAIEAVDTLPMDKLENITIVSKDANAKIENGKIIWNVIVPEKVGNVAGKVILEYTATVKSDVTGTIENDVVLSDGTEVESTKDPIITSLKTSSIEGKENVAYVTTGDVIVYTIKVTNTSKDVEATNVEVTDVVPAGTKLVEGSITENGTTTDNKNITWNIEKIDKDSFVTVSFKVEVLKNELNTKISNTAYVEETKTNTDEKDYTRVNFDVEKTSSRNVVKLNEDITYTITVTNSGTGAGEDTVTDIIPVENVDLKIDSINVTKGKAEFTTPNLNWTLSLEAGESATLTYTVTVKFGTKIENSVVTSDGEDKTTTPVITIEKQAKASVRLDGTIEYTIIVKNTSDVDSTNVVVSDTLREGLVYNNDASPKATYNNASRTLEWTNQTIKANSSNTYTFTASIDKNVISIGDEIKNTAKVDDTSSNEITTEVKDYVITSNKTVDKSSAKVGDTLTYTITLINSGNIVGYANVEDILSENVTYNSASGITVTNGGSEYTATYTDGKITVNNIKVEPNINAVVTFKVEVNSDVEVIKNKATVTVDGNEDETNETVTTTISKSVKDINGNDVAGQNVKLNDILVYSITVNNVGNDTAKNVVIKDIIPQGTTFVSATNGITPNGNNELIWNVEVPANGTYTVTFSVSVTDLTNNTQIKNTATVDGNATNEVVNNYVEAIISGSKRSTLSTAIAGEVVRGTNITYTITATNDGGLAKDVEITDLIPEGTTFVSADDGKLPVDVEVELDNKTTITRKMLSWTVTVPANSSVSKQFVVTVNTDTIVDSITNTATVDGTNTNTTEDKVYYEDRAVRFSKKTDTIIGKNIVMVLDVSHSMNGKALPEEINYNSECEWISYGNECSEGYYYDHYYDRTTGKYYHYKTRLEVAKEVMNSFLENIYKNEANNNMTVDIITFAGSVRRTVTVNKSNYETTINGFTTASSTDIEEALKKLKNVVSGYTNGNNNMVIFIGDGDPNEGETSSIKLGAYADTIYNTKASDTTIYSIGIGITSTSNAARILNAIATSGQAELSTSTDDLITAFNNAATRESFVNVDKMSTDGMIKDYAPTTTDSVAINVVDGTKDIIVRYGSGVSDYYTFSATDTQTSIQVLNSDASQALLATKGISVIYDNTAKKFTVNLRNCTITSPLDEPVIQIIYY